MKTEQFEFETTVKNALKVCEWDQERGGLWVEKRTEEGQLLQALCLTHESEIPTDWPESARAHCRAEIRKHREPGEHEARNICGDLREFEIAGETVIVKNQHKTHTSILPVSLARQWVVAGDNVEFLSRLLAYYDKHAPKPEPVLAGNEVLDEFGRIILLKWDEHGERRCKFKMSNTQWSYWDYGNCSDWEKKADAWFDANQPLAENQYRDENGKVQTLGDDEVLNSCGELVTLRWHNGERQVSYNDEGRWYGFGKFSNEKSQDRAEAWFERNRPLADDETVSGSGKRGKMSIDPEGDRLIVTWSDGQVAKYPRETVIGATGNDWARRRAFYDANVKKPEPKLATNQVLFDCGTVGRMAWVIRGQYVAVNLSDGRTCRQFDSSRDDIAAWTWDAFQITSEAQRQRVRDFARDGGWSVSGWDNHTGVSIYNGPVGSDWWNLKHERELSSLPASCPQHVLDLARARILEKRPIDPTCETRQGGTGEIWRMTGIGETGGVTVERIRDGLQSEWGKRKGCPERLAFIEAHRELEPHEFRPVNAPETIGAFVIEGELVRSKYPHQIARAYYEHSLSFSDVRDDSHCLSGSEYGEASRYIPNALRMIAWCKTQSQYLEWLAKETESAKKKRIEAEFPFVRPSGLRFKVRPSDGGYQYQFSHWDPVGWVFRSWEELDHVDFAYHAHRDAIREICGVTSVEAVTQSRIKPEYYPQTTEQKLGKLVEECGEVLAAIGKTQRWGLESTNPELPEGESETNREWILRELGDLKEAIDIVESTLIAGPTGGGK